MRGDAAASHYARAGLEEDVLAVIRSLSGEGHTPGVEDLHAVDAFHLMGRHAAAALAAMLGDIRGSEVLDAGSGPGGTARYLASTFGCVVTGIDVTPQFVSLARRLSELVSMGDQTTFVEGSVLRLPFEASRFDIVWMEHVQVNIEQKEECLGEIRRVLRPGGRFVFHEVFCPEACDVLYPVPWADEASVSFLVDGKTFRALLERTGFRIHTWNDVTAEALRWGERVLRRISEKRFPRLGLHLLMGESTGPKLETLLRNLHEGRLEVIQGICEGEKQADAHPLTDRVESPTVR